MYNAILKYLQVNYKDVIESTAVIITLISVQLSDF